MAEAAPQFDDKMARRNALFLAMAQGCASFVGFTNISFGGLVGQTLSSDKLLATLSITTMMLGTFLATLPLGMIMQRYGRRAGFLLGAAAGMAGGLICMHAINIGNFWLFCLGTHFCGYFQSSASYYRFAAADIASPKFRPTAISWSLAGGLLAALAGPVILSRTDKLWLPFSASFFAVACSSALAFLLVTMVRIPRPASTGGAPQGRPLLEIIRQPRFMAALAAGAVSFGMMNLVMTSTPLAMAACNFTHDDATGTIRWHVLAMYLPSFFTGSLIARFGRQTMALLGMALLAGCGLVALSGVSLMQFSAALIALGLGWNFAYISATTMVTDCHTPEERGKTQAFNDLTVFGFVALTSYLAGRLMNSVGWEGVNLTVFPFVALAALLVIAMPFLRVRPVVA